MLELAAPLASDGARGVPRALEDESECGPARRQARPGDLLCAACTCRKEDRLPLGCRMRTRKKVVLASHGKRAYHILDQIGICALLWFTKAKDVTRHRVLPRARVHQSAQAVKALAHVGGLAVQIVPVRRPQPDQGLTSVARNEEVPGTKKRASPRSDTPPVPAHEEQGP